MALCRDHKRFVVGGCILCGKELCDRCVARSEGAKVWCVMCSRKMRIIPHERVTLEDIRPKTHAQKKLDLPKEGYFDFTKVLNK